MKGFIFACLALSCILAVIDAADDPKDGMACKTQGGFEICEGKSKTYSTLAEQGEPAETLETRSFGGGSGPSYGFMPKQLCDFDDHDKCQQLSVVTTPTFMKNARNEPRYILQSNKRQQKVQLAICSDNKCGRGKCDQQYATIQLLACAPMGRKCIWTVDSFRVPSCCKCTNMKWPGH